MTLIPTLTAWGGAALLVQAIRSLDVPGSAERHVRVKQRQRGFSEAEYVESLVVLHALGGDCVDDLNRLREDAGIPEVLGYAPPSPKAARKFLSHFHEDALIEQAQQALALERSSYIPRENAPLAGLAQVNRDVIAIIGRRSPDQKIATVDQDPRQGGAGNTGGPQAARFTYSVERRARSLIADSLDHAPILSIVPSHPGTEESLEWHVQIILLSCTAHLSSILVKIVLMLSAIGEARRRRPRR